MSRKAGRIEYSQELVASRLGWPPGTNIVGVRWDGFNGKVSFVVSHESLQPLDELQAAPEAFVSDEYAWGWINP